jgi:uncharacterized protein YggU (UPF0235/DUF167 family)
MYIHVQVKPDAARNAVKQIGKGAYVASLRPHEPQAGKDPTALANITLTHMMAKHLNIPRVAIKMWAGRNQLSKKFVINDEYLKSSKETQRYGNIDKHQVEKPASRTNYGLIS